MGVYESVWEGMGVYGSVWEYCRQLVLCCVWAAGLSSVASGVGGCRIPPHTRALRLMAAERTFTDEYGQLLPPGCRLSARRLVLAGANSIPGIPSIPGNSARSANYRSKQNCEQRLGFCKANKRRSIPLYVIRLRQRLRRDKQSGSPQQGPKICRKFAYLNKKLIKASYCSCMMPPVKITFLALSGIINSLYGLLVA